MDYHRSSHDKHTNIFMDMKKLNDKLTNKHEVAVTILNRLNIIFSSLLDVEFK
jgi:hypothetical protein